MPRRRTIDSQTSLELLEYTVAQLGGRETVLEAFYGDRIRSLISSGITFGELLAQIGKEPGLDTAFRAMTVTDIQTGVKRSGGKGSRQGVSGKRSTAPGTEAGALGQKKRARRSPNLSHGDREIVGDSICAILKDTPWIQVAELRESLAKHVQFNTLGRALSGPQLHTILRELRQANKIRTDDGLGTTRLRYALRSAKGAPPAA